VLHPAPKRALVVGLGTGATAGWLAVVPGMERVDAVELEPAIAHVAAECAPINQRALERANVRVRFGDAREVLLTTTTLIMAGVESLGGFMMMFAYNLATFDEARRAVVAKPELLPDAIEESLRFNTSAQRFRRRLMKDVELHGQTMRQGDFVCLAYGSGNRDERQYPNPDAYDITRKPRGHLGFGGGVHACLGTAIARLAVKIAFDEFHKVVPDYKRVADQLAWMPSSTFRSPLVLELKVQ